MELDKVEVSTTEKKGSKTTIRKETFVERSKSNNSVLACVLTLIIMIVFLCLGILL